MCISHHMTDVVGIARNKLKLYGELDTLLKMLWKHKSPLQKHKHSYKLKSKHNVQGNCGGASKGTRETSGRKRQERPRSRAYEEDLCELLWKAGIHTISIKSSFIKSEANSFLYL